MKTAPVITGQGSYARGFTPTIATRMPRTSRLSPALMGFAFFVGYLTRCLLY